MEAFLKTGKLGPTGSSSSNSKNKSKSVERRKGPVPWVEKYRPRSIEDVVYQDEVVSVLRKTLQGVDFPNILFYGPPGTGKTSTILAVARELFGDLYKQRVMELNASDERGIQVIRDKVKTFAQTSVSSIKPNGQPCPPYKIIILDEADSMTSSAQAALRRTMEKQSKTTRFCLICNYVSRIIDPLTSRCAKFRFKPLSEEVLLKHLNHICEEEGVSCQEGTLNQLIDCCEGDLRKAITFLQSITRLKGGSSVSKEDVFDITATIPDQLVEDLFSTCKTNSYEKVSDFVETFFMSGYSAVQLINQLHDKVILNMDLSEEKKSLILEKMAECDYRLCNGADEFIQTMDLSCVLMKQMCH